MYTLTIHCDDASDVACMANIAELLLKNENRNADSYVVWIATIRYLMALKNESYALDFSEEQAQNIIFHLRELADYLEKPDDKPTP